MLTNEKLVEFIKADWEAKREFEAAAHSPFNKIGFQTDVSAEQFLLIPKSPSSFPLKDGTPPAK